MDDVPVMIAAALVGAVVGTVLGGPIAGLVGAGVLALITVTLLRQHRQERRLAELEEEVETLTTTLEEQRRDG